MKMKNLTRQVALVAMACGGLLSLSVKAQDADSPSLIEKGRYLSVAGDCTACHTNNEGNGQPFAGGKIIATPLGNIIASNITPSKDGIGDYTLQQFDDALRKGIRADGKNLYPAMPYTAYSKLTDDDVKALYAYFMHGVQPVDEKAKETDLPFPFNVRLAMSFWNTLFFDGGSYVPDPKQSEEWNRGAYLAGALAHCTTCHTPRNALMGEKNDELLGGSSLGSWYAPNITSDKNSGIGTWSQQDIVDYLRTGHAEGKAQAAGPMAEAITYSLQHLSDADLKAMAVWLKTVPPVSDPGDKQPAESHGAALTNPDEQLTKPLAKSPLEMDGGQLYDAYCASCHQADGMGSNGLPSLVHNTALGRQNTDNLVMAVLEGVQQRNDLKDGGGVNMPAFHEELNDEQVAKVSNYVLANFGRTDKAGTITGDHVKELRNGGPASPLLALAQWGMGIGGLVVLVLVIWFIVRRRKK